MGYLSLAEALRDADFDEVELVGFSPAGEGNFRAGPIGHGVAWSRVLDPEARSRLRALIQALPGGVSARCHEPPFGLRLGTGPRALHVSICFRCNNAYVANELTAFEAGSPQARALLAFLRGLIPGDWKSPE
jgi:hypothetical protein